MSLKRAADVAGTILWSAAAVIFFLIVGFFVLRLLQRVNALRGLASGVSRLATAPNS